MRQYSLAPRLSFLSALARKWLRLALLAGLLGIIPAASALADRPTPYLVKDIYPGITSSQPHNLTAVSGTLWPDVRARDCAAASRLRCPSLDSSHQ